MMRAKTMHNTQATIPPLDASSPMPLYRQLYEWMRQAILAGQLGPGAKLPSTRVLAAELHISRNTVLNAFAQLLAEGYLEGKLGAGTYVSRTLPEELLHAKPRNASQPQVTPKERALSRRGAMLLATPAMPHPVIASQWGIGRAFLSGIPALDHFPREVWARLQTRQWQRTSYDILLGYGEPAGYHPLREAIAAYLGTARGVRCTVDQVIVVSGSQQGIDLTARVLLNEGDAAWIEEPGYPGTRGALLGAGARLIPVPVDGDGLDVAAGIARCSGARLASVTPSHQFPLGVTMSLSRRLALLDWASRASAWVLEDDYDSEYRYGSRPLAALQGLDRAGRVIYLGTFSKVLFPALRLGYLVVPPDLVTAFTQAHVFTTQHAPILDQAVLADFITEGHFARHIRRMRTLYEQRQRVLVEAASHELDGLLNVSPANAGMHLVGWLPEGVDEWAAARRAAAHDVDVLPLATYSLGSAQRGGLLLGYAGVGEREIHDGVRRLATALKNLPKEYL